MLTLRFCLCKSTTYTHITAKLLLISNVIIENLETTSFETIHFCCYFSLCSCVERHKNRSNKFKPNDLQVVRCKIMQISVLICVKSNIHFVFQTRQNYEQQLILLRKLRLNIKTNTGKRKTWNKGETNEGVVS